MAHFVRLTIIPAALQFGLLFLSVESPRHLVNTRRIEAARNSLRRLRNLHDVENELELLIVSHERELESAQSIALSDFVRVKSLRRALFIALAAQVAQQFSGVNGVVQYSTAIFSKTMPAFAQIFTVGIGFVNLLVTFLSVVLMDLAGRRVLLLASQFGLVAISGAIVIAAIFNWHFIVAVGGTFLGI